MGGTQGAGGRHGGTAGVADGRGSHKAGVGRRGTGGQHGWGASEWRHEVRQAEVEAAAGMLYEGRVGRVWGWAGEAPSWKTGRGWREEPVAAEGTVAEGLAYMAALPAEEWGPKNKQGRRGLWLPNGLMEATLAHMRDGAERAAIARAERVPIVTAVGGAMARGVRGAAPS